MVKRFGLYYNRAVMKTSAVIIAVLFLLQAPLCVFADRASATPRSPADQTAHDCCAGTEGTASPPLAPSPDSPGHCDIHCATLSQAVTSQGSLSVDQPVPVAQGSPPFDIFAVTSSHRPISNRTDAILALNDLTPQNLPLLI